MSDGPGSAARGGSATPELIMEATYCALCRHGYADLTMRDIADESDRSKASLHYHYDTKEDLLLAFLDHLYASFTDEYATVDGDDAVERLVNFVDAILRQDDGESDVAFKTALLEIKAQGPYVEQYREELKRFDAFVRDRVREIVVEGIDEGTIREDVDPDDTAAFVATLIDGVNTRRVSIGETDGGTRRTFLAFVRENLVASDADVDLEALERAPGGGEDADGVIEDSEEAGE